VETKPPSEQHIDLERHKRETLNALIGKRVIHTLGEPAGLLRVQVRRLWENHYRVNILIGADAASGKVANSYFLQADGEGNILQSTPKILKQY
jgi:hypothetical protein